MLTLFFFSLSVLTIFFLLYLIYTSPFFPFKWDYLWARDWRKFVIASMPLKVIDHVAANSKPENVTSALEEIDNFCQALQRKIPPPIQAQLNLRMDADVAAEIQEIATKYRPAKVLHIGSEIGRSTLLWAQALQGSGYVVTVNMSPSAYVVTDWLCKFAGLDRLCEIRAGSFKDNLDYLVEEHKSFDVVYVEHGNYQNVTKHLMSKRLVPLGCQFIGDHIIVSQATEPDANEIHLRQFKEKLNKNAKARAKFNELDINKDGVLDTQELMLLALWIWEEYHEKEPSHEDLEKIKRRVLAKADKDGNNMLTWDEFTEFYHEAIEEMDKAKKRRSSVHEENTLFKDVRSPEPGPISKQDTSRRVSFLNRD